MSNKRFKVIIQEDDKSVQEKISNELKGQNYEIEFMPKELSIFDIMQWNPDIVIPNYQNNEIIKCYEWNNSN